MVIPIYTDKSILWPPTAHPHLNGILLVCGGYVDDMINRWLEINENMDSSCQFLGSFKTYCPTTFDSIGTSAQVTSKRKTRKFYVCQRTSSFRKNHGQRSKQRHEQQEATASAPFRSALTEVVS